MQHRPFTAALVTFSLFAAPFTASAGSLDNPSVPTGEEDAIFVVGDGGFLEPIAVRLHGKFIKPGSNEGEGSDKLRMYSQTALGTHGNRVNVIFGGRVVATVPAKVANGGATITVPPSLHLNQNVNALASPTLGGHAASPRRAPTAAERAAALAAAAKSAGVSSPALFEIWNLTAMDLGRGTAFIGALNVRGTGSPRKDKRVFFIAEPANGTLRTTLLNVQPMTINDPMLESSGERLIDAIDLGDGSLSVVTIVLGYDAHTYEIYSRKGTGWKKVYEGGGVAL